MGRGLSVWSAGCSYGAEPYSLRMVLDDMGWRTGVSILATDIDQGVLARAQAGCFAAEDLRNVPAAWRERYFTPEGEGFQVRPTLKQGVTFRRHDLLRDTYPQQVDLILCRNVVIYFTEEAKARLFETMCQALRPGGFLFIGSTERIADAARLGLVSREAFIYQRPCTNG
jgi:chemotaxis protein methyltransferase CheR